MFLGFCMMLVILCAVTWGRNDVRDFPYLPFATNRKRRFICVYFLDMYSLAALHSSRLKRFPWQVLSCGITPSLTETRGGSKPFLYLCSFFDKYSLATLHRVYLKRFPWQVLSCGIAQSLIATRRCSKPFLYLYMFPWQVLSGGITQSLTETLSLTSAIL